MEKKEILQKMVTSIMENFDFEKVHKVMHSLDWKWAIEHGESAVPSIYRIMKQAEGLLQQAVDHYEYEYYECGTGGLRALLNGNYLRLSFNLAEWDSEVEDYTDN